VQTWIRQPQHILGIVTAAVVLASPLARAEDYPRGCRTGVPLVALDAFGYFF